MIDNQIQIRRETSRKYYAEHKEEIAKRRKHFAEINGSNYSRSNGKRLEYIKNWNKEHAHELYIRRKERERTNPEKYKEQLRLQNQRRNRIRRLKVIDAYGGRCECCGETRPEFLTLDHSFGDGGVKRRELKSGGLHGTNATYNDIIKRGFPKDEGLRILCWNCNCSIGSYGYCPHKEDKGAFKLYSTQSI